MKKKDNTIEVLLNLMKIGVIVLIGYIIIKIILGI